MNKRQSRLIIVLIVLLSLTAWWSRSHLVEAKLAAEAANASLFQSQRLATSIQSLRKQPQTVAAREMEVDELSKTLEAAAKQASIQPSSIKRIDPQTAQRLGDTPYKQKNTRLEFQDITFSHLLAFAQHLQSKNANLKITSLRVFSPHSNDTANNWNCELTITYLLYSPPGSNSGN